MALCVISRSVGFLDSVFMSYLFVYSVICSFMFSFTLLFDKQPKNILFMNIKTTNTNNKVEYCNVRPMSSVCWLREKNVLRMRNVATTR